MKKYVLFDLDGTLTDPKEGITTCVQYALKEMGIEEPDPDKLEPFIGPPLKESFKEFYHMSEEDALKAVEKYRERFQEKGIFENKLYDGIPAMLRTLQSKGMFLAVASSKPTVYVEQILEHFRIAKYFQVVVGSELDGRRVNKQEVIAETLKRLFGENPIQKDQVYMVGDRRFDIEGAKALRIDSVGVSYGYGSMEELKAAKADYIVRTVEELESFLLRGTEESNAPKATGFQRVWRMLFPFLMFLLVRSVAMNFLNLFMLSVGDSLFGPIGDFFIVRDDTGAFVGLTGNTATIMSALSFVAGAVAIWPTAKFAITKTAEDMKLTHLKGEPPVNYVLLAVATVGSVIGVNLLFELMEITDKSAAYTAVREDQYSAYILVGLLCYGVVTPIAEELLFRGILYNYMKRFMNLKIAVIISAFLFGAYHMNTIQGVYGFVIGCLMAFGYEYFGSFKIPVLIHMASNILAYCLSYTGVAVSGFVSWPVCILFLAAGAGSVLYLNKQKNIF